MQFIPGFITDLNAQMTIASVIWWCFLVLNYWATTRIIRQAGYSRAWMVVPLSPLVLSVAISLVSGGGWNTLLLGFAVSFLGGNGLVIVLLRLDELSIIVCWLFFMLFALSQWPALSERARTSDVSRRYRTPSTPARGANGSNATPTPGTSNISSQSVSQVARFISPSQGGVASVSNTAGVLQGKNLYCGWCAEPTPGNRALSHNCGSDDRPLKFCRMCGQPFAEGATGCGTCST